MLESFLSGREFTISILGTGHSSRVIGIREHIWDSAPMNDDSNEKGDCHCHCTSEFASREAKSNGSSDRARLVVRDYTMARVEDPQISAACKVGLEAWKILMCRDAGRVDIRFNNDASDGVPNILEVLDQHCQFLSTPTTIELIFELTGESHFRSSSRTFSITDECREERDIFPEAFV